MTDHTERDDFSESQRLHMRQLERNLAKIRSIVDEQARDEGLWFEAATASEGYLQAALRRLHAAVEGE